MTSNNSKKPVKTKSEIFWEPVQPFLKILVKANTGILLLISFLLPFAAWLIGLLINPNGWTADPTMLLAIFVSFVLYFYESPFLIAGVALIVIVAILIVRYKKPSQFGALFIIMPVMLAYSIYYLVVASTAPHDEFTE